MKSIVFIFFISFSFVQGDSFSKINDVKDLYSERQLFFDYNVAGVEGTIVKLDWRLPEYVIYEGNDSNVYVIFEYKGNWLLKCLTDESKDFETSQKKELNQKLREINALEMKKKYDNFWKVSRYIGQIYGVIEQTVRYDDDKVMNRHFLTVKKENLLE